MAVCQREVQESRASSTEDQEARQQLGSRSMAAGLRPSKEENFAGYERTSD
jgi:hypothetical protein